ncbi:hypothetical protein [Fischerella sp. PCC 9605]|uniref:hypothetical protein n=1 Tax=Fischerella sp. PCC 9605 TaxID=1173024 RepID=UPI00047ACA64|nr:hypothetical protein [Fischerella sp. PCC 9605]
MAKTLVSCLVVWKKHHVQVVRPRLFQAIVRAQVTAIACSKPADFDIPLAKWSCSDIATQLITLGIGHWWQSKTGWKNILNNLRARHISKIFLILKYGVMSVFLTSYKQSNRQ